jgi:hypothetical protein
MKCTQYKDIKEYFSKVESFLLQNESENNLQLGLASRLVKKPAEATAPIYLVVEENRVVIGAAIRTDMKRPFNFSKMNKAGIDCIIDYLHSKKIEIRGCHSEEDASLYFAETYCDKVNKMFSIVMHQGIYELNKLIMPPTNDLKIIPATIDHYDVVYNFVKGFTEDCFPNEPFNENDCIKSTEQHIERGNYYLLKNKYGEFISAATNNRQTENSGCISWVYTPKNYRGNGFGSLVTALVTREILNSGKKFCNLFTDLSNPTSNGIYQNIGYKLIAKAKHFRIGN